MTTSPWCSANSAKLPSRNRSSAEAVGGSCHQESCASTSRRISRWPATGQFVGGVMLALLLPTLHNYAAAGELIPATTNWGQIYFIGNNATNPNGRFQELSLVRYDPSVEHIDLKREAQRRAGSGLAHRDVSRFWFAAGLEWTREHPGDWARLMWSKFRVFWGAYETPASLDYYLYRRHAPVLRIPLPGFGLLGPLALLGCVLAWPRRGWPRLLVVISVVTSLLVTTFFVLTRFRMVLMPALYVLAALGAVELARRMQVAVRDRRRIPALIAVLLFAVFGVFVNLPVQATVDSWRYNIAGVLHLPRKLETTARAHWNLGVHYAARADESPDPALLLELAELELRTALEEDAQPTTYLELGKVLARSHRNAEAIEVYRRIAEFEPNNYRTHHVLGLLHRRVGDLDAAEAAFHRALSIAAQHAASSVQLGEVLLERGRNTEAAEQFRRALSIRPDDRAARAGLATAESR
jgi:hypothetical protein